MRRLQTAEAAGRAMMPSLVAAAIAGFLGAGLGGRFAMFVLRITSGPDVVGLQSDDDFEIGRVTLLTVPLVLALTAYTTFTVGPAHALTRLWLPPRWRPVAFATVLGLVGGGGLVHANGIDFQILTPRWLAVGLFILVPASVGVVIELVYDRVTWARRAPGLFAAGVAVVVSCLLGLALGGVVVLVAVFIGWCGVVIFPARAISICTAGTTRLVGVMAVATAGALGLRELARDISALF